MINDADDMGFIAAFFCAAGEPCNMHLTDYCREKCEYCRFVPGWEEIADIVRDEDRLRDKEMRDKMLEGAREKHSCHFNDTCVNILSCIHFGKTCPCEKEEECKKWIEEMEKE